MGLALLLEVLAPEQQSFPTAVRRGAGRARSRVTRPPPGVSAVLRVLFPCVLSVKPSLRASCLCSWARGHAGRLALLRSPHAPAGPLSASEGRRPRPPALGTGCFSDVGGKRATRRINPHSILPGTRGLMASLLPWSQSWQARVGGLCPAIREGAGWGDDPMADSFPSKPPASPTCSRTAGQLTSVSSTCVVVSLWTSD